MTIKHEPKGDPIDEVRNCTSLRHKPSSYEIGNERVRISCNICDRMWTFEGEKAAYVVSLIPGVRVVRTGSRDRSKLLGEMRGTGHELDEWSDEDLRELRATATQLAARAAVELVKRSRSAGPTV